MRTTTSLAIAAFALAATPVLAQNKLKDGLYAKLDTSKGAILLQLEFQKTPMTVANFVGLAEGTKDSNKKQGTPFYDGLKFHRVIKDFMIQGGCPQGTGTGGPGYRFPDEFHPSLKHKGPGVLSMANAGPGTNGSQFFITHKATPWLDNKHTVFGHVVQGQKIVDTIARNDSLKKVTIIRVGKSAQAFKVDQKKFDKLVKDAPKRKQAMVELQCQEIIAQLKKKYPKQKVMKTKSGLRFVVTKAGEGEKAGKNKMIAAHYTGKFLDGKVFDSSKGREPIKFTVGVGRVIPGWDEALADMKKGEKRVLIIPPELAYGKRGYPGAIPPNATLVFDVELVEIN